MVAYSMSCIGSTLTSLLLASSTLSGLAGAHLFISSPSPIPGSAPKDPLEKSGSNFPCHGVSLPSSGGQKMQAGSSQELKFDLGPGGVNTAVHGGGSCQLSLTYETDPAKVKDPKNWHVIYSIEGGCPANTKGNLNGAGPDIPSNSSYCAPGPEGMGQGNCVHTFDFDIPKGVKDGHATLAWTWFNTIGNREMYMNCVNVDIAGGDGSEIGTLPPMFIANVASETDCGTTENENVAFPSPGKYMTKVSATDGAQNYPIATPANAACGGGGSGGAGPTSYPAGAPSSSAPSYGQPSSAPAPSYGATSSSPAAPTSAPYQTPPTYSSPQTMSTVTGISPSGTVPAAPAYPPTGGNGTTGTTSGEPCTDEGALICIGSDSFGICDHGLAVARPLAQGTSCTNGVIERKRMVRHAARHVGRFGHS